MQGSQKLKMNNKCMFSDMTLAPMKSKIAKIEKAQWALACKAAS